MEEKKKCPYCGEEILAVAKKCKHCGEWLDKNQETKSCPVCDEQIDINAIVCSHCNESLSNNESDKPISVVELSPEDMLYCKSCNKAISKEASSCPHCGDSDPFYFKDLTEGKKKTKIGCWSSIVWAFLVVIVTQELGISHGGLLHPDKIQFIIFISLLAALYLCLKYYLNRTFKEYSDVMKSITGKKNDSKAYERWKALTDDILNYYCHKNRKLYTLY